MFYAYSVRSLYRAGSLMTVAKETSKYKLFLVGVWEVRWDSSGIELAGECTVTCTSVARQWGGKHIPTEANVRNIRMSVARQRSCEHASLTIEDCVFCGVCTEELSSRQLVLQV
jgi:hypothetical protein